MKGVPEPQWGPLAPLGSPNVTGVLGSNSGPQASSRAHLRSATIPGCPPAPPITPLPMPTGPAVLRSAEPVALGQWHWVTAERVHKDGTLVVDDAAPVKRSSPGKSQGLNLRSPLYLGGTEPPLRPPTNISFHGCIGEVRPLPLCPLGGQMTPLMWRGDSFILGESQFLHIEIPLVGREVTLTDVTLLGDDLSCCLLGKMILFCWRCSLPFVGEVTSLHMSLLEFPHWLDDASLWCPLGWK